MLFKLVFIMELRSTTIIFWITFKIIRRKHKKVFEGLRDVAKIKLIHSLIRLFINLSNQNGTFTPSFITGTQEKSKIRILIILLLIFLSSVKINKIDMELDTIRYMKHTLPWITLIWTTRWADCLRRESFGYFSSTSWLNNYLSIFRITSCW